MGKLRGDLGKLVPCAHRVRLGGRGEGEDKKEKKKSASLIVAVEFGSARGRMLGPRKDEGSAARRHLAKLPLPIQNDCGDFGVLIAPEAQHKMF